MLVVGVVSLVALLGVAAALWVGSGQRRSDNIAAFARAPVGCDTTLDFEATGTFFLYVETSGEIDLLAGECDADQRYDRDPGDPPDVAVTLIDADGALVELGDPDSLDYDVDGFVGAAVHNVQIETPGDHVLTVAPTEGAPFAVAVGRSPDEGVALLRWGAVAAAIAGLVIGGVFLALGSRRMPPRSAPAAPWTPDAADWPASPPGFPAPPPTTGAIGPAGAPPPPTVPEPMRPPAPPAASGEPSPPSPWAPPG
jgi:hypothetical protein